jgi:hypothetical protein
MSILSRRVPGKSWRIFKNTLMTMLAAWLLLTVPALAAEPVIIVSVKSYNELQNDATYLGTTLQQPLLGFAIPGLVGQLTQGKGLLGLDQTKRIGAYLTLQADGTPGDVVVMVPVSNQKLFAETLATIFPNPSEVKNLVQYQLPNNPQPFFGKPGAKHFLFALSAEALAETSDPEKLLKSTADIGIEVALAAIPEATQKMYLEQIEAKAAEQAAQSANSNPADAAGEALSRQMTMAALRRIVLDGDRLSLGLNIDVESKAISLDLGFTARSNTVLSSAVGDYTKIESPYAGLVSKKTVGSYLISASLNSEVREVFERFSKEMEAAGAKSIREAPADKQESRTSALKMLTVGLRSLFSNARTDQAIIVNASTGGKIQVISAMKAATTSDLKKAFDDLVRKDAELAKAVRLGAAQVGTVAVHAITFPPDADVEKLLGNGPAHVAITEDAILFTAGDDSLGAMKAAIGSKPAKSTRAPVSLRIALANLLPLINQVEPQVQEMAKAALSGGNDEIALEVVSQPQGAKLRLQIQEGILRLIGTAAAAKAAGQ